MVTGLSGRQLAQRRGDGRLGRAIGVEDLPPRRDPAHHEIVRAGFAADQQQRAGSARRCRSTTASVGLQAMQVMAFERRKSASSSPISGIWPGAGHERRAGHERHPDFLDREVEGDRHALIDAVARPVAVGLGGDAHEIADAAMLDDDALRLARRARRVEDVADVVAGLGLRGSRQRRVGLATSSRSIWSIIMKGGCHAVDARGVVRDD